MVETTKACQMCLKEEVSPWPTKEVLSVDGNPVLCYKCKIDKEHQGYMQNGILLHSPMGVKEVNNLEKIKDEFVEVAIKNEEIVKEEYTIFNKDIPLCSGESTLFYCDQCNYAANDKQNLTNHIFTHCFTCNLCSYTTFNNSLFHIHKGMHLNLFQCHDCGYLTKNKSVLEFHVIIHKRLYNCKYRIKKLKNLRRHLRKRPVEMHFSCDKCEFKSFKKTGLIRHKIRHTKQKLFECNLCDYCSNRSANLKRHLYRHPDESLFRCDKCNYKCYNQTDFTAHNRTHTEQKMFKCDFCDYCSRRLGNMKRHIYKHSVCSFRCDKCDYKCQDKSNLELHKLTHSHEKLFQCSFCHYSCNASGNLKKHQNFCIWKPSSVVQT